MAERKIVVLVGEGSLPFIHPNFKYMELNEFGLKVWKHKTNKRLFLQQSYRWKDDLLLIDETEGRQIIQSFKASTFDYDAWVPMVLEEYNKIKYEFKEIYNKAE